MKDPQDEIPVYECCYCGGEIYRGNEVFEYNSKPLCSGCAHEWDFWEAKYTTVELIHFFLGNSKKAM